MADEKKRKTGLGMDAFFPPSQGTAEAAPQPPAPETVSVATPLAAPPVVSPKPAIQPETKLHKTERKIFVRAIAAEPQPKNAGRIAAVKLTAMIRQDQLEGLEELKDRERKRRRQGGETNYRQAVTVTKFVIEALDDLLVKKGIHKRART